MEESLANLLLLGNSPLTVAVGQIVKFLTIDKDMGQKNIIILADGDEYDLQDMRGKFTGTEGIVYVTDGDSSTCDVHPLAFLTQICPARTIPLTRFSIVELARAIEDIGDNHEPRGRLSEEALEAIFAGKYRGSLSLDSEVLKSFSEKVHGYLHSLKTPIGASLRRCLDFLENPGIATYGKFVAYYNESSRGWRKEFAALQRLLGNPNSVYLSVDNSLELSSLQADFEYLNSVQLPEGYSEADTSKNIVHACKGVFEKILERSQRY